MSTRSILKMKSRVSTKPTPPSPPPTHRASKAKATAKLYASIASTVVSTTCKKLFISKKFEQQSKAKHVGAVVKRVKSRDSIDRDAATPLRLVFEGEQLEPQLCRTLSPGSLDASGIPANEHEDPSNMVSFDSNVRHLAASIRSMDLEWPDPPLMDYRYQFNNDRVEHETRKFQQALPRNNLEHFAATYQPPPAPSFSDYSSGDSGYGSSEDVHMRDVGEEKPKAQDDSKFGREWRKYQASNEVDVDDLAEDVELQNKLNHFIREQAKIMRAGQTFAAAATATAPRPTAQKTAPRQAPTTVPRPSQSSSAPPVSTFPSAPTVTPPRAQAPPATSQSRLAVFNVPTAAPSAAKGTAKQPVPSTTAQPKTAAPSFEGISKPQHGGTATATASSTLNDSHGYKKASVEDDEEMSDTVSDEGVSMSFEHSTPPPTFAPPPPTPVSTFQSTPTVTPFQTQSPAPSAPQPPVFNIPTMAPSAANGTAKPSSSSTSAQVKTPTPPTQHTILKSSTGAPVRVTPGLGLPTQTSNLSSNGTAALSSGFVAPPPTSTQPSQTLNSQPAAQSTVQTSEVPKDMQITQPQPMGSSSQTSTASAPSSAFTFAPPAAKHQTPFFPPSNVARTTGTSSFSTNGTIGTKPTGPDTTMAFTFSSASTVPASMETNSKKPAGNQPVSMSKHPMLTGTPVAKTTGRTSAVPAVHFATTNKSPNADPEPASFSAATPATPNTTSSYTTLSGRSRDEVYDKVDTIFKYCSGLFDKILAQVHSVNLLHPASDKLLKKA